MHICQRQPTNYRLFLHQYNSANCYELDLDLDLDMAR